MTEISTVVTYGRSREGHQRRTSLSSLGRRRAVVEGGDPGRHTARIGPTCPPIPGGPFCPFESAGDQSSAQPAAVKTPTSIGRHVRIVSAPAQNDTVVRRPQAPSTPDDDLVRGFAGTARIHRPHPHVVHPRRGHGGERHDIANREAAKVGEPGRAARLNQVRGRGEAAARGGPAQVDVVADCPTRRGPMAGSARREPRARGPWSDPTHRSR